MLVVCIVYLITLVVLKMKINLNTYNGLETLMPPESLLSVVVVCYTGSGGGPGDVSRWCWLC